MKKIFTLFFTLLIFSYLHIFISHPALATTKDYFFPKINIEITVSPDGSFSVVENRTVSFTGSFSRLYWDFPKKGSTTYQDFQVSEGSDIYSLLPTPTSDRPPNHYAVTEDSQTVHVELYHQSQDETRTFTLKYKVVGGITKYQDVAELYWQVIGNGWEKGSKNVTVNVHLPSNLVGQVYVWGHGPLSGKAEIIDTQTTRFSVPSLPSQTFFEIRTLFPTNLITGEIINETALSRIRAEEEKFQKETAEKNRQGQLLALLFGLWFLFVPPLTFLLWLIWFYRTWKKIGQDYQFADIPQYLHEPPSKLTPAEVNQLLSQGGTVTSYAFTATVFDLARRGYFKIYDEREVKSGFFGAKISYRSTLIKSDQKKVRGNELASYEQEVLNLLFNTIGHGAGKLPFEAIKDWMKKNPLEFQSWFRTWEEKIKKRGEDLGFLEKEGQAQISKFWLVTILLTFFTFNFLLIFLGLFLIPKLKRRKYQWAKEEKLWESFKNFLSDFSNFKELPPQALILWDQYLVYGILFGVADKILKALPAILAQEGTTHPTWYTTSDSTVFNAAYVSSLSNSLSSLTASFVTSTTLASSFSSGGGGGGGAD